MRKSRLIVVDPSIVPSIWMPQSVWFRTSARSYEDRALLVVGDNFHLYSLISNETGEAYIRAMSRFINEEIVAQCVRPPLHDGDPHGTTEGRRRARPT